MKNLADLQAECAALGLDVTTTGRASKDPYIAALRDYHRKVEHPNELLPPQIQPMLLSSWDDLTEAEAQELEEDHHRWIVQPKLDVRQGVGLALYSNTARPRHEAGRRSSNGTPFGITQGRNKQWFFGDSCG